MKRIGVELTAVPSRGYEVVVGAGALSDIGAGLRRLEVPGPIAVIADAAVYGHWGAALETALAGSGYEFLTARFPAGERSKSRDTVAGLQDELIAGGIDRDGCVVALGGGVAGDIAGFVAATLYRGIRHVQVPTTLLAMVDSSVGGKTGVDVPAGKNLVGAFHQPSLVVADVSTLSTLPDAELHAGLAEVIKYGVIVDEQLFTDLEDGLLESCVGRVPEALALIVERCVRLKAEVVAGDEREAGRRQVLNFGHTLGHAVELLSDFALRHGEAVAIGMVAEARLACQLAGAPEDLPVRVAELCARAGLPVSVPAGMDSAELVRVARRDKKARRGTIRCALPAAIGTMAQDRGAWAFDIDAETFVAAFEG